jgi:hypothetical protein
MTYVPPLRVLRRIGDIRRSETTVTLPTEALHALIRAAFAGAAFDPVWYRATYPDVDRAIAEGHVPDEMSHFACFGYFENRKPRAFEVDKRWYEATYQDVGQAIRTGLVADARSHFNTSGYFEPRAPNPQAAAAFADLLARAAGQASMADGAPVQQAPAGGNVLAARRIRSA